MGRACSAVRATSWPRRERTRSRIPPASKFFVSLIVIFSSPHSHHILTIVSHQRRTKFSVSSYRNHHSVSVHQHNQYPQNVHHCNFSVAPTVSLHIGKALNLNDLEEGDDVYFECSIQVFFFMIRYACRSGTRCIPQLCQLVQKHFPIGWYQLPSALTFMMNIYILWVFTFCGCRAR